MIKSENVLVFDIDGTICESNPNKLNYLELKPKKDVVSKIKEYKSNGFYIILYSSRQMRSFEGNVGRINAVTAKNLFIWLEKHNIDFDEIHFGKPWCGINGFYIDDRAIRPSEFLKYSFEDLTKILEKESKL